MYTPKFHFVQKSSPLNFDAEFDKGNKKRGLNLRDKYLKFP